MTIKLVDLYHADGTVLTGAIVFLYELMKERDPEVNISHQKLPTFEDHTKFVEDHPFRYWYLIRLQDVWIGYIFATNNNEIGICLRNLFRGQGLGPQAVQQLMSQHKPLPAIKAVRNGHWLANIAPTNTLSKRMFEKLGFRKIQETYVYEEETHEAETQSRESH